MATTQNLEVHFAQRLASNDKTLRTKAIKKLKKYITIRSQKTAGGFTADELLKLWKGLFYCLWMQDKPLLQEDLSNQISTLIHSFNDFDQQLLYLECFIQTFKREWTGIDRLRMDKFFQMVRFMFTQMFETLKRKKWESGAVSRFLELLTTKLLQNASGAPSGLQFHILDLYTTELAAVGASELTAEQNLKFIEPFCKTAAKTKDRTLFSAICSSIFTTIIDQAPFAIEDLMKELKACEDTEQASEDFNQDSGSKKAVNHINGKTSYKDDDDDIDAGDLPHLEHSDIDLPGDDIGPVLQFDYAALADKLFELASRSCTPGHNRERLYKIIKVLRDLNEGIFLQDKYPEEVSTDEDDELFGSRKKKRSQDNEEGEPAVKKSKGKQVQTHNIQNKAEDPAVGMNNDERKKKNNVEDPVQGQSATLLEAKPQGSISTLKTTEITATDTLLPPEVNRQPSVTVTHSQLQYCITDYEEQKKKRHIYSSEEHLISRTKKKKQKLKGVKAVLETCRTEAVSCGAPGEKNTTSLLEIAAATSLKRKKKSLKVKRKLEEECRVSAETPVTATHFDESAEGVSTARGKKLTSSLVKKGEKENPKADDPVDTLKIEEVDTGIPQKKTKNQKTKNQRKTSEIALKEVEGSKAVDEAQSQVEESTDAEVPSNRKKVKKEKRKISVVIEFDAEVLGKDPAVSAFTEEEISLKKTKLDMDNSPSLSKKVTFGLKNNKTAEFRKTDRSLLVSPGGSSRVPFDPEQKPKYGVLKSPFTAHGNSKKIPKNKTTTHDKTRGALKRLVASDFF